jgi:Na+/melibiose symporter-like transporter
LAVQKRGSRRTFLLVAVVVVVVVLPLLWLALQTVGGTSSKGSAVAASSLSF